jgi:hypothetical protein
VAPCWKNTRSAGLEVLKGRKIRVPVKLAPIAAAKVRVHNWDVLGLDPSNPASDLLGPSIWRPLQGASLLVDDFQG